MTTTTEKTVFITAASKRIGLHIAKRLIEDNYSVIGHYRTLTDGVKELEKQGATMIAADLSTLEGITNLAEQIQACTPTLRAIVHNASAYEETVRSDIDKAFDQYNMFFHVHMVAPYVLNEKLYPLLIAHKGDRDIIHITDISSDIPDPRFDIYSSTKAALTNLSKSFARRFAPQIKVNCVAPGPVLFSEKQSLQQKEAILNKTLLGVEGGAEPVYLATRSILENNYLTGICIEVDGGRLLGR